MRKVTKEEVSYQKQVFETHRQWLSEEYKKAVNSKPKNNTKIYELENRVKSFEREIKQFNKIKKELGVN